MQYKIGTVSVTNGSAVVVGVGTTFLTKVSQGDAFTVTSSGVFYDVASVDSDTQITLSAPYAGASQSGATYAIARDFTPLNNIVEMRRGDIETAEIFTRAMRTIDQKLALSQDAGAITSAGVYPNTSSGISGTSDGDYFFVPDSQEFVLYLNNSGIAVEQLRFASLAAVLQYASDAQAAQVAAELAESNAAQSASDAADSESNAAQSASDASDSASNALASEITAAQQAGLANDAANEALGYSQDASDAADRAEQAADGALLSQGIYPDTVEGLGSTQDGEYFSTPSSDANEFLILYRNDAGTAVQISEYPSRRGLESLVGIRTFFNTSTTYTLPEAPSQDGRHLQIFTKTDNVTPIINASGSDLIRYFGEDDTTLEYDLNVVLTLTYDSGVWYVLYE